MARMTIRATYALDEQTNRRIRHLAKSWQVSQAEVVRRSVKAAVERGAEALTPKDVVKHYRDGALPRSKARTREAIRALRAWRREDDKRRTGPRTP